MCISERQRRGYRLLLPLSPIGFLFAAVKVGVAWVRCRYESEEELVALCGLVLEPLDAGPQLSGLCLSELRTEGGGLVVGGVRGAALGLHLGGTLAGGGVGDPE